MMIVFVIVKEPHHIYLQQRFDQTFQYPLLIIF